VIGYGVGRFWIEGLRIDTADELGGLRWNQWVALVSVISGVIVLAAMRRVQVSPVPITPPVGDDADDADAESDADDDEGSDDDTGSDADDDEGSDDDEGQDDGAGSDGDTGSDADDDEATGVESGRSDPG
jgi:hypothetical protein